MHPLLSLLLIALALICAFGCALAVVREYLRAREAVGRLTHLSERSNQQRPWRE